MYTSCTQIQDCSACTSTPVPNGDGTSKCQWSVKDQKCGSFPGNGYRSTCEETGFLASLKNFGKALMYGGKNIKTTDGTIAYVTDSGMVKGYMDMESYEGTMGKNGCPTMTVNVAKSWTNLGYPTGSVMLKGQSCGNETKYVTAAPPENDFSGPWYREAYPELKLTTDEDALNDWETSGKGAGRLPNSDILKTMANLGKVGYVDPNTMLRSVVDFTFNGVKPFKKRSNVTGATMVDCTASTAVKYGDRVVLSANDSTGFLTSESVLEFGKKNVVLWIRSPPGSDLNGTPVKFGDKVSLALSVTNYSSHCGYWGCKVGNIDPETLLFVFGPGGASGGTQLQVNPSTTAYALGDDVAYDSPFILTAVLPKPNNALFQGDELLPGGERIPSADNQYYLTYQTDGFLAYYKQPDMLVWKSEKGDANPRKVRINNAGSLEAINQNGVTYWSTETTGSSPFALAAQSDGRLVLYEGSMKELWAKGTATGSSESTNQKVYASVSGTQMLFDVDKSTVFSFQTKERTPPSDKCDLADMRKQCGEGCVGFIHNPEGNEWQQIKVGAKDTDFKITTTMQDVYMKVPMVRLGDSSCKEGPAEFVNATTFANYVKGDNMVQGGKDQCASLDKQLQEKQDKFNELRDKEREEVEKDALDFDQSPLAEWGQEMEDGDKTKSNKIRQLKLNLQKMKKAPGNITYQKQAEDAELLERSTKMKATLWLIAAVLVVGVMLLKWYEASSLVVFGSVVAVSFFIYKIIFW